MKVPTMVEVIQAELKKRVLDGEYVPGDRLNVDELARVLNVSKTPIREALGRLAREGIVQSQPRIGWRVSLLSLEEFFQYQETQHILKTYLAEQIFPYLEKIDIKKIEKMNGNMRHFISTGQFDRMLEENDNFHMEIFSVYPNKVLLEYLEEVNNTIRLQRIHMMERQLLSPDSPLLQDAPKDHEEIIEAIKSGDRNRIIETSAKHQATILAALQRPGKAS
jgi:DNA-binding GntR family transcriptional regulator